MHPPIQKGVQIIYRKYVCWINITPINSKATFALSTPQRDLHLIFFLPSQQRAFPPDGWLVTSPRSPTAQALHAGLPLTSGCSWALDLLSSAPASSHQDFLKTQLDTACPRTCPHWMAGPRQNLRCPAEWRWLQSRWKGKMGAESSEELGDLMTIILSHHHSEGDHGMCQPILWDSRVSLWG